MTPPADVEKLYTPTEVAELLGATTEYVRLQKVAGNLTPVYLNGNPKMPRYPASEVARYQKSQPDEPTR